MIPAALLLLSSMNFPASLPCLVGAFVAMPAGSTFASAVPAGLEPRPAMMPPDSKKRFTVVVEGLPVDKIAAIWGDLCQPTKKPSADFLAVYPKMTLVSGNRFKFIDGNPEQISAHLARVLQSSSNGGSVKTFVEK